jgi:type VI secretion system protein ImpF
MQELPGHHSAYVRGSILDRLTAPAGDDYLTGARRPAAGGEQSAVREDVYRDSVLRDLEWLFNAVAPLGLADADVRRKYPRAAASVLGYGLRGMLGRVVQHPEEIEKQVATALKAFEPRLIVEEMFLRVSREGQLVEIEIRGLLLTQQVNRQLWIRTDLETLDSRLNIEANG